MHYYEIAPNVIIRLNAQVFTYHSAEPLSTGSIVRIEIGKKTHVGVITKEVPAPSYETKPVIDVVYDTPVPIPLLESTLWLSEYYSTHLASCLQTLLPRGLTKKRRITKTPPLSAMRNRTKIVFNSDQLNAIEQLSVTPDGSAILHGITGSGKTAVYIALAKQAIAADTSVIILVPEIALTSQLVAEFEQQFDNVIVTHSKQTEAERHITWQSTLTAPCPQVIIGPRSALFMPVRRLGLIVIDEFHEPAFKQEQSPRYSALRFASILASYHKAKVVYGSATPPIAEYYLAKKAGRPIADMPTLAKTDAVKPIITLVDMTKKLYFSRHRFLSSPLITAMDETLASGKQVLIYHNRRGSASMTLCETCGWSSLCPVCFVPHTLHADTYRLICHICNHSLRIPTSCPECSNASIIHKGIGTKLIEEELKKLYPNKTIARFDGDTEASSTLDKRYQELYDGTVDIVIGTQVVAKGLDLPQLRMVGIVQADAGLSLPDYTSSERTFQLISQAVGRVGRSRHPTNVIIQSYQPTHPAVALGITQDYAAFYEVALKERKRAHFPPYCHLLKLTCIYKTEAAAIRNARALATILRQNSAPGIHLLGPTPAFYERTNDTYRWQIVVKSPRRSSLQTLLQFLPSTHWQYELDPLSLL